MSSTSANTVTVRIPTMAHEALKRFSEEFDKSLQDVVVYLIEREEDRRFFDQAKAAYEAMRKNPDAMKEEIARRDLLDNSIIDGLGEHLGGNKSSARRRVDRQVRGKQDRRK